MASRFRDGGRRIFREHPSPFELISVGRLVNIKGYPLLLDAVAQLRQACRDVRLTLAGDGPDRASLEAQAQRLGIADRVFFAGWKNQDELRELYRGSDACVMSSFAEGVPVVLMEAMATGVPCVAPRINGIPELIRDGVDGLLFTASDVEELVAAVGKLMDIPTCAVAWRSPALRVSLTNTTSRKMFTACRRSSAAGLAAGSALPLGPKSTDS